MGRKSSAVSFEFPRIVLAVFLAVGIATVSWAAIAADLPLAAGSPLVGFTFDDRPLMLPVQRNFQMAMLTASSELGRSCGKMESYGWRMKQSEQQRVDQIFNNTVDRLRGIGYAVQSQVPNSISRDITLFTADRSDKHFVFMWSAGEIGLVMVLCESSPPLVSKSQAAAAASARLPSVQVMPPPRDVVASEIQTPMQSATRMEAASKFSPVGQWVGSYTCAQGYTGGTLDIKHLNGENFDGEFRFYPTAKNPLVPKGSYAVYGQYDRASQRILINPGKWIVRPQGYYDTIMIGSFDPVARSFSAYFQGIIGCTSFEAHAITPAQELAEKVAAHKKVVKKKKKAKKPAVAKAKTLSPADAPISTGSTMATPGTAPGIALPAAEPASTSAAPAVPAPTPATPPAPAATTTMPSAIPPASLPAAVPAPAAPTTPAAAAPAAPVPAPAPTSSSTGAAFLPPSVPASAAAAAPVVTVAPPAPATPVTPSTSLPAIAAPSMQPAASPSPLAPATTPATTPAAH